MFVIENIIRKLTVTKNDKLNIIVYNDGNEDYINRLCWLDHNFYIQNGYNLPTKPYNLFNGLDQSVRAYDAIIVFNRANMYDHAKQLSDKNHIPIINVDLVGSNSLLPIPFYTNVNMENAAALYQKSGTISVAASKEIYESWSNASIGLSTTIQIPSIQLNPQQPQSILLDPQLPNEFVQSLPITILEPLFTTNIDRAAVYLHLWQHITPLMLDCMASNIPVVTFKSVEFNNIIESKACIIIDDIKYFNVPNILQQLLAFKNLDVIKRNAVEYIEKRDTNKQDFIDRWTRIFNYVKKNIYMRGQA